MSSMDTETHTLTVIVSNIPKTVIAKDLFSVFESALGHGAVFALEIFTERKNWKSKGHGRVQFDTAQAKIEALSLSQQKKLLLKGFYLSVSHSFEDIVVRPVVPSNRVKNSGELSLSAGIMLREDCMGILESWNGAELWLLPERKKLQFFVNQNGECYKLEVQFGDVWESRVCCLNGNDKKVNAVLLKIKHAPKVFRKMSGQDITSRFCQDRYHISVEDLDFVWVRTTDFSRVKSIGYLSTLFWEIEDVSSGLDMHSLPFYSKDVLKLALERVKLDHASYLAPVIANNSDFHLAYEVLFQLNSLVHAQKISIAAVDADLFQILCSLELDTALLILKKMHELPATCYDPKGWIKSQSSITYYKANNLLKNTPDRLKAQNVMSCQRILVTPSRIFCLGPELVSSNYIVKNFASYVSDFVRVTFVDEDWGRLSPGAVSMSRKKGIFAKSHRTDIYLRMLHILQNGIIIGEKRFEFLAFSASQLRSNSVWMFASNDDIKAEDIRKWMGCFNKIRSISKCAARMGQLFSSSMQTLEVCPSDVDHIPDIEVVSDGVKYNFSDGIGKISCAFAKEVAHMLGLSYVPSAFQIRYGGYKGVIVVNRQLFCKLALRGSMLKFDSTNYMLNVTKWSESQPCYLNREIITLLSTLGVKDDAFLEMQANQLQLLRKILTDTEVAVNVLGVESKTILPRMLRLGYLPTKEPYLYMMIQSFLENQISDLRSRSRVFVPKGRVLIGVLDETGTLKYGQVYVRINLNRSELESVNKPFFKRVDKTTAVIKGRVVVTKNPCLHPGDVRVLEAVCDVKFLNENLVDCLVFPQKGDRPHTNECSGGDLDGDLYFISWDVNLIPPRTVDPMDYSGARARIMDHEVTLEEIQRFFADYMMSDTLGPISNAHLVHADREPDKALSSKCLELAALHSMAVDFAKSGAPADMPRALKPREFPDFMERWEKPMYVSRGALGKLYRALIRFINQTEHNDAHSATTPSEAFDPDLIVDGYEGFLETAESHREQYSEKMKELLNYYGAESEVEILTGNVVKRSAYLQRDNRRYGEVKDRIQVSVRSLMKEVKGWFKSSCSSQAEADEQKLASAWYFVTYSPTYAHGSRNCLGFPWTVGSILLDIKAQKNSNQSS